MVRSARTLFKYLPAINSDQRRSREELDSLQWQRFQRLLHHATRNSPFYRKKFAAAGISPHDIRCREDLRHLPITKREDLRNARELVVDGADPDKMHRSFSSGSTGQSVETFFDPEAWIIGKTLLKARARFACGVRPWHRIALFQATGFRNSPVRRLIKRQISFSALDPIEKILPRLRSYKPHVLYGFPGHFRMLAEKGGDFLRPTMVITSGEMLNSETRRIIQEAFRAPVYDVYGSTEVKEIAWECPRGEGYHLNSDWLLLETGDRLTSGDDADRVLLVTSLYNYGMPMIRYQIGDTGRMLEKSCSCGRSLPLMAPGFGRSVEYFVLPDGSLISPYTLINPLEELQGIAQFQLIQDDRTCVVVCVVPVDSYDDSLKEMILNTITPLLPGLRLAVVPVDKIPPESNGKYRIVRSRLVTHSDEAG